MENIKVICGARRTGKTTALIKESAETGAIIICRSHQHISFIKSLARDLNLKIPTCVLIQDIASGVARGKFPHGQPALIDDVEFFLGEYFYDKAGFEIKTIGITGLNNLEHERI
jgi:hypothetical protein